MINEGVKNRSVARKISTLKSYYNFLLREQIVLVNPLTKVQTPKIEKRLPEFVETESMVNLFDERRLNPYFKTDFEGKRNKLIVLLFYTTGIRLSELMNLTESNIDFYKKQIKVLGKRNKERIIPITTELILLIKDFQIDKTELKFENQYLLTTNKGDQIYLEGRLQTRSWEDKETGKKLYEHVCSTDYRKKRKRTKKHVFQFRTINFRKCH
jgi:integrase/recombinase XerC